MNTKYILTSAILGVAVLAGSVSPIFAQSPTSRPWQEKAQDRQENRQEKQEERMERRCDLVNNRIDARINHYNNNSIIYHLRDKITKFIVLFTQ